MSRLQGGGFLMIGAILVVAGVLLRWDLVDWIIDTAGFLLIVLGAVVEPGDYRPDQNVLRRR